MKPVLIVEDSRMFAKAIKHKIESELFLHCDIANTMVEATKLIKEHNEEYFAAVLELNLSDSNDGEIVDYVVTCGIPAIVFTSQYSEELRERMLRKQVLDYIIKEGEHVFSQLVFVIRRLMKNRFIKVLVVDDSASTRLAIRYLLEIQLFEVLEAKNGIEALEILDETPEIKLVITDYNMPKMDGFELISNIRKKYTKDDIVVIGISSYSSGSLSAKFLKKGANDFITKPLVKEEFYWRLNQNIEMREHIEALRDASIKDYLTGLFNRRYFFSTTRSLYKRKTQKENIPVVVAMLDVDHFKQINDTYGHDSGDQALIGISSLMKKHFSHNKPDNIIISRLGGEEFCVFCAGLQLEQAITCFEEFRKEVENNVISTKDHQFSATISIGLVTETMPDIETAVKRADELLYAAKKNGRNQVQYVTPPKGAVQ